MRRTTLNWRVTVTGMAVTGVALLAAACGSSQTATQGTSTATEPGTAAPAARACAPAQLAPSYAGTDGATGHMEVAIALRNVSGRACRVAGYPDARLLGPGGRPTLTAHRGAGFFPDTTGRPRPLLLRPGHSAHYGISFVTNNEYAGAHVCHHVTGALSALPGHPGMWQRVSLRHAPRLMPCGSQVLVSAIHA